VWAGVDSAWEQKKLEARKMPELLQNPIRRVHPIKMVAHPFSRKKPSSTTAMTKYTLNWQVLRSHKAMETRIVVVPWCTVVAGQLMRTCFHPTTSVAFYLAA